MPQTRHHQHAAWGWLCLSLLPLITPFPSQAQSLLQTSASPPTLNLNLIEQEDQYLLGPGDRVKISVLNEPDLGGEQQVLLDGTVNLPMIGTVLVKGKTIPETTEEIESRLAAYLKYPSVNLSLLNGRSLRINVIGEVNRPGGYSVAPNRGNTGSMELTDSGATTLQESVPRVTQLLQLAGGITQKADIRNIEIRRQRSGGDEEVLQVDLWALLQEGDSNNDPIVLDGDSIMVPVASSVNLNEVSQLSAANFSPETITVNVVGEVTKPGPVKINPNTTLNTAILSAGGFTERAQTTIQLIRLNPNGSVDTRDIAVDYAQSLNDQTNPSLREGDVVVVRPSGLAQTSDNLDLALNPLNLLLRPLASIGNLWRVIDLISN